MGAGQDAQRGVGWSVPVQCGADRDLLDRRPTIGMPVDLLLQPPICGHNFRRIAQPARAHMHLVTTQNASRQLHEIWMLHRLQERFANHEKLTRAGIKPRGPIGMQPSGFNGSLAAVNLAHRLIGQWIAEKEESIAMKVFDLLVCHIHFNPRPLPSVCRCCRPAACR